MSFHTCILVDGGDKSTSKKSFYLVCVTTLDPSKQINSFQRDLLNLDSGDEEGGNLATEEEE